MNIKEHIEAGHYPTDEKGRALVPMQNGSTACIIALDNPVRPAWCIVGFMLRSVAIEPHVWLASGGFHNDPPSGVSPLNLLPPPPKKVKVTGGAIVDRNGNVLHFHTNGKTAQEIATEWGKSIAYKDFAPLRGVELTGEYEEPWS